MKAWHILAGLVLVGGGAAVALALTREADDHGLSFNGCDDVSVRDPKTWGEFFMAQAKVMITQGRRDADAMIAEIYAAALPQCRWPPPEDSPLREKWDRMAALAKQILVSWFPESADEGPKTARFEAVENQPAETDPPPQFKPTAANAAKIGALLS